MIWVLFVLLTVISSIAVYSAIGQSAIEVRHTTPLSAWGKHMFFVLSSYVIAILVCNVNYRHFAKAGKVLFVISAALLLYCFVTGERWLYIPGLGSFQPSELAKVALIAFLANMLAVNQTQVEEKNFFGKVVLIIGATALLIFPENFSTAALLGVVCMVLLYFGGINRKYWLITMGVILLLVVVFLTVAMVSYQNGASTSGDGLLARTSTWGHRVFSWMNPNPDELTQENMARMAIASGGLVRLGIGHTVQARLMTQADNDFIYAIIIEETGALMGIVIFAIYSILYFRCLKNARRCDGLFGSLLLVGYGTLIYFQALVNMFVAVGVLPVTGQTLPLISNGGTAYWSIALAIGAMQAVTYETAKSEKKVKEKIRSDREFEEVKDLSARIMTQN